MAKGKAPARRRSRVKRARRAGDRPLCLDRPFCVSAEVEFDRKSIRVNKVELFDPDAGGVWAFVPEADLSAQARAAALAALKRTATDGSTEPQCADGCDCELFGNPGPWSRWFRQEISGGFSIKAPNPPPARLQYRARGTVRLRTRLRFGFCLVTQF